jgi:putative NIF3 family GTP cyclohydrolase 1 type 2
MKRREFVNTAGTGLIAAAIPFGRFTDTGQTLPPVGKKSLTAGEINAYLRSLCEVEEPSVDRIITGDPDTVVKKIGTAWMPYWETLKKAAAAGVNVMVVHEPTFYSHWDLDDEWDPKHFRNVQTGREKYLEIIHLKKQWIEEKGMVVIRCHDVWDKIPEIGIPFALGQALGFTRKDIIRSETYYNVYRTASAPAIDIARRIAAALKSADQQGIAFYGDETYPVESVGVGTGCICDPMKFMHLEPDLFIAIDDAVSTWIQTTFAEDTGRPLVVINHGTSEEFGIRLLNENLVKAFPDYEVMHFNQGCSYKWITG